jgi:hypothetical protein
MEQESIWLSAVPVVYLVPLFNAGEQGKTHGDGARPPVDIQVVDKEIHEAVCRGTCRGRNKENVRRLMQPPDHDGHCNDGKNGGKDIVELECAVPFPMMALVKDPKKFVIDKAVEQVRDTFHPDKRKHGYTKRETHSGFHSEKD